MIMINEEENDDDDDYDLQYVGTLNKSLYSTEFLDPLSSVVYVAMFRLKIKMFCHIHNVLSQSQCFTG